jgi:hypothetical protein
MHLRDRTLVVPPFRLERNGQAYASGAELEIDLTAVRPLPRAGGAELPRRGHESEPRRVPGRGLPCRCPGRPTLGRARGVSGRVPQARPAGAPRRRDAAPAASGCRAPVPAPVTASASPTWRWRGRTSTSSGPRPADRRATAVGAISSSTLDRSRLSSSVPGRPLWPLRHLARIRRQRASARP